MTDQTTAAFHVGTRVLITGETKGDHFTDLSIAERQRLADGKNITGTITGNDDLASHHGYAVAIDVPDSTIPRKAFIAADDVTALHEPGHERRPLGASCVYCGSADTWIEFRFEVKPVGTYSLAGAQMKFSATTWPYAVCDGCGHVSRGKRG